MESRDINKSFAHTGHRLRESRNAENSVLSAPVEPIKMLFLSTSSGWERVPPENNGRTDDISSKSPRPGYGVDSPNAMLKYACRNRAHERLQQGSDDKHAFPGGDLTRRDVPVSTYGRRSSRAEAPPPLVGSPDMPMPGIPVAEVRESVMISRLPSGPSIVEKKPSVTNLHVSRENFTRISEEGSCSRKQGGGSYRQPDIFLTGLKHDRNSRSVERTTSKDLHSASSVFQTVSKALERRNKHNYDYSIPKNNLKLSHIFRESSANPEYSSSPFRNISSDIQNEGQNTLLNNMNNTMFHSLSSIDEILKAPDVCEYRNISLHSNSSMVRIAQNAQHDLHQSVIKFEELIDVVSNTMTELHNISTSDSFDSYMDKVPKRNDYRRYRQVQEVTSNVNCYVTTDPGLNPVTVSAFTTTTVTNIGGSRRSNHSVGDSFLNDYPKKSSDFSPHIDGCYKINADESGDRNIRNKHSSVRNQYDKNFHYQEGDKPNNIHEKENEQLSKTLKLAPSNKNQEAIENENDKMKSSDTFSKEICEIKESKKYAINTLENESTKEPSGDAKETQEYGMTIIKTEENKSHANVNCTTEGLGTNASTKPETITQRQGSNKLTEQKDSVANSASVVEKSPTRGLDTRITKLNEQKFYRSITPAEIAHSIISDYSKSISASENNRRRPCQQQTGGNFEKNELKMSEDLCPDNNNALSQKLKAKTAISSDVSDFSDSTPNSPRKAELESRGCESVILDEKPQRALNSDVTCVIQVRTTTEMGPEKHSELKCKNTSEEVQTKSENITEQCETGEIKSERSRNEKTNVEVNKYEKDTSKEFTGSHILQSLDRKVLDVMELVRNQSQKERTRLSPQLESANVRRKTQKNTVVRNDSGKNAKDEKPSTRHYAVNKHLDSRSNKCSRRDNDHEAIFTSSHKDRQIQIHNDISRNSNEEKQSSTSLRPVATQSVKSEESDLSKQPEPDRAMLDSLVDSVTGLIKFKKLQMCLIDTLTNGAAEPDTQQCSKRVTHPISPRLQRKSALPKSSSELEKEKVSSIGILPTSARCSLMCQDTRVECIASDLKKREEEIKKPLKPKETTKELHLKTNQIGISNNLITAAKRENNREVKSVNNQARDKKCVDKNAKKQNLEQSNLKNSGITVIDDKGESGSDKISPVGSAADVYDIKVNIINRSTSNTNMAVKCSSETINNSEKESCSQVISNSSDKNNQSDVNRSEPLNEISQEQLTNRGKDDQKHYTECKSKLLPHKNVVIRTESNEVDDSRIENEDIPVIPHQIKDDIKLLASNNDTKLIKPQSGNNNLSAGDKQQCKNNKSVPDRKAHLKRNNQVSKCTSPNNSHSPNGDRDSYHTTNRVPDNFLKVKEQNRTRIKSCEKTKEKYDKYTKLNPRWGKPCQLEPTDRKTKSAFSSGTPSFGFNKLSKLKANKSTTSSDRSECKRLSESQDFKGMDETPKLFEGYACGSYVKVDAQLCAGEQKETVDSGGISKVHIKTNTTKQTCSTDESSQKSGCYEETINKTKVFSGYGAALLIKPNGHVTEINWGRNICSKRSCNCSKQKCCETERRSCQVEISQATSSADTPDILNRNKNDNKIHTNESLKDIISSKYSAVKLLFEKPSRPLEEKIIGQVYYENGFVGGNKTHIQPFDFILNGIKFSDKKKLMKHKSSITRKYNSYYDNDALCLFSHEENNVFNDRNKIVPTILRRGSSAQSRSTSVYKEIPAIEKRLSTLIEILESLINKDSHENISCKSSTDIHEKTETLGTKEHEISIEEADVGCEKHIEEESNESTLECIDKSKESTTFSDISKGQLNSEINTITPETGTVKNQFIQFETDVSHTISTKGKSLSEKILSAYGSNGEITKNNYSSNDQLTEEGIIDKTFSRSHRTDRIDSNIEMTLDAPKSENKTSEDVNIPLCENKSYELETLKAYEGKTSMECTDSSKCNEFLNQSRCSSCSTLFSSCDSLTTNDYVEIFRGYIDGDNSTEKEVDLYDDSTESSNITQNSFFTKQKLEEWKMNILRNKDKSHSSEISYNLTAGRVSSSDSTAHYPSESEVSTYPRRISTQSSNISSLKRLYCTERNGHKRKNNLENPDVKQEEYKGYSVADVTRSKCKNNENDGAKYWTFDEYSRADKNSSPECSNRIGINVETFSEVTSSNPDREIFPSLSSIISKCVEETLNDTLRDITASFDFEKYGHALSQKLQSYNVSEHSSYQELTVNNSHACETTDSESNSRNRGGKTIRTIRINVNPFSEDSNEYPSSCSNSHREILSSGCNEILNDSSSNSEVDVSKSNCTSNVSERSQYNLLHSTDLYRGVRNSATAWQRGSQKTAEEEDNSQASTEDRTNLSSENSEVDESSASHGSLESVQDESPVAVQDLTSPETVTRVLDAMAHSEERQPIGDELEGEMPELVMVESVIHTNSDFVIPYQGEMGVYEFHDLPEFVMDECVIHASSDLVHPYHTDDELEGEMGVLEFHDLPEYVMDERTIHASGDLVVPDHIDESENTRSDDSFSLERLAEQFSAAVLTRSRTSSTWLEGTLRRLSEDSSRTTTTTEVCRSRRTREDRGGGALAISICVCLFVFVCNRSFLYGDDEY